MHSDQVYPPLRSPYEFNEPGQAIVLHEGPLAGILQDENLPGTIEYTTSPKVRLVWRLQEEAIRDPMRLGLSVNDVAISISRESGKATINAHRSGPTEGWFNGIKLGSESAPLQCVLAHWLNLPDLPSDTLLEGRQRGSWYHGRRVMTIAGWRLTIDERSDHSEVWRAIKEKHAIAVTHIMKICREDGSTFTGADVIPVLAGLQYALSFALGRWVAPTLPLGFNKDGLCRWEEWGPSLCSPGRRSGVSWWYWHDDSHLDRFLEEVILRFSDPEREFSTRFMLSASVLANETGFVEQRIMTAFTAIEHISWVALKLARRVSGSQFDALGTSGRLEKLLSLANVPCDIDDQALPALYRFAEREGGSEGPLSGPAAITKVRNKIVHPENIRDKLYKESGIPRDAWLLTVQYLTLLLLWELKYAGKYQKIIPPNRWFGEVEPVPWTV